MTIFRAASVDEIPSSGRRGQRLAHLLQKLHQDRDLLGGKAAELHSMDLEERSIDITDDLFAGLRQEDSPASAKKTWTTRRDASTHSHNRRLPTATTPSILDELNRRAFPYRCSTRAVLLDKTEATKLLTKIWRQWFTKRKSIAASLKEVMTNEASVLVDTDAANKADDADIALQELGADNAGQAYVTAMITVWDEDPPFAREASVQRTQSSEGVVCTALAQSPRANGGVANDC